MSKKTIKNIVFDWGGVITNIDFDATINAFKALGINNFENYYCKAFQAPLFQQHETGKISVKEFRNSLRSMVPFQISDAEIDNAWFAMLLETPPQNLKLIESLRDHYNIYLLSNTNEIHVSMYDKIFNDKHGLDSKFRDLFKKAYYSHEVGFRKPGLEIFEFVLKDENLKPEETLFIDDSIQNIEAANNAGIITFHMNGNKSLTDLFQNNKLCITV